jgi:hypothetical protein
LPVHHTHSTSDIHVPPRERLDTSQTYL